MKTPQEIAAELVETLDKMCEIGDREASEAVLTVAITAARSEGRKAALEHAAGIASDELTKHALVNIEARSKGDKSGCESTDSVGAQSVGAMRALSTVEKAIRASAAQPKPEVT